MSGRSALATRPSAAASWANGSRPGTSSVTSQRSEPGTAPVASAGSKPALTADDLPIPEGPMTSSSGSCRSTATISATDRSRPKKSSESACSNASRPAIRVPCRDERRRWGGGDRERVAQLVHQFVDRLLPSVGIGIGGASNDGGRRTLGDRRARRRVVAASRPAGARRGHPGSRCRRRVSPSCHRAAPERRTRCSRT